MMPFLYAEILIIAYITMTCCSANERKCVFTDSIYDTDANCLLQEFYENISDVVTEECFHLRYSTLYTGMTNAKLRITLRQDVENDYAGNPSFVVIMMEGDIYHHVGYCEFSSKKRICWLKLKNTNNPVYAFAKLRHPNEFCYKIIQFRDSDPPWCQNSTDVNCLYFDENKIVRYRTEYVDTSTSHFDPQATANFLFFKHPTNSKAQLNSRGFLPGPEISFDSTSGKLTVEGSTADTRRVAVGNFSQYLSKLEVDDGYTWCFIYENNIVSKPTSSCVHVEQVFEPENIAAYAMWISIGACLTLLGFIIAVRLKYKIEKHYSDSKKVSVVLRLHQDESLISQDDKCKTRKWDQAKEMADEIFLIEGQDQNYPGIYVKQ